MLNILNYMKLYIKLTAYSKMGIFPPSPSNKLQPEFKLSNISYKMY